MTILDEFDNDVRRLISFSWGAEAGNPFPQCVEGRLSQSNHPDDEKLTEGEALPSPITALQGLSKEERRMQASQIRGKIKRLLDAGTFALIELRMVVPVDPESRARKILSFKQVTRDLITTTTYPENYIERSCKSFGRISDGRVQGRLPPLITGMFYDALDIIEHRL